MERQRPVELVRNTAGMVAAAGHYALHQLAGGAWGELAGTYGEAMGGHRPHPASIQFYHTGELSQPDIPDNIVLGVE